MALYLEKEVLFVDFLKQYILKLGTLPGLTWNFTPG